MSTSTSPLHPAPGLPAPSAHPLARAWLALAAIPVSFVVAFALGYLLYGLMGYQPEEDDAPLWADVAVTVPTLAVCLAPCAAAFVLGRRAVRAGRRHGHVPVAVGALAGLAVTLLTVVIIVADAVS